MAKKPEKGTLFPTDDKGGRSTTFTNKKVIETALRAAGDESAAGRAAKTSSKKWRWGYDKHYMSLVRASCKSPDASKSAAKAAIEWMYDNFEHKSSESSPAVKFSEMLKQAKGSFGTRTVRGKLPAKKHEYVVPYDGGWSPSQPKPPPDSANKVGSQVKDLTMDWVNRGIIESDAAQGINWTVDYFDSGKDLSKCHFVLIGAGSAMGPFSKLLEHGANVVAIDIPGCWGKGGPRPTSGLWKRLISAAENSSGSITFPIDPNAEEGTPIEERAGCDLMQNPGEIANWLEEWARTIPPSDRVCVGNYTYLDGELHVKLALCADVCIKRLRSVRPSTTVAFLCTPTDIHVIPEEVQRASAKNAAFWHYGWLLEQLIRMLSFGKALKLNALKPVKDESGNKLFVVDGLSLAQGPNYALAKRLQHFRAQLTFEEGGTVSSMVAPSTATLSVIHNKTFAWAYGGMPFFKYEVFKQETTNAVMAALLVHDVLNDAGSKNPKNRNKFNIKNSLQLFSTESVHGGLWRSPYKVDSLGEVSALIYFMGGPTMFVPVVMVVFAAVTMLATGAVKLF